MSRSSSTVVSPLLLCQATRDCGVGFEATRWPVMCEVIEDFDLCTVVGSLDAGRRHECSGNDALSLCSAGSARRSTESPWTGMQMHPSACDIRLKTPGHRGVSSRAVGVGDFRWLGRGARRQSTRGGSYDRREPDRESRAGPRGWLGITASCVPGGAGGLSRTLGAVLTRSSRQHGARNA